MFTGLVEQCGRLGQIRQVAGGRVIEVASRVPFDPPLRPGESVAVQGVCLTVTNPAAGGFAADMLDETWNRGAWKNMRPGMMLNLERALQIGSRLGGHWVTGHVDGTGVVSGIDRISRDRRLRIACPARMARMIVEKGSIALDGVSLTVATVGPDRFEVHIIPATWSATSLCERRPGDLVNLETDLIAKHVCRLLDPLTASEKKLGMRDLESAGFGGSD